MGEGWKMGRSGKWGGVENGEGWKGGEEGWKEHKLAREGEPGRKEEA